MNLDTQKLFGILNELYVYVYFVVELNEARLVNKHTSILNMES